MPKTKDEPKPGPGQYVVKVRRKKRREISRSEAHKATLGIKRSRTPLEVFGLLLGLLIGIGALGYLLIFAFGVKI